MVFVSGLESNLLHPSLFCNALSHLDIPVLQLLQITRSRIRGFALSISNSMGFVLFYLFFLSHIRVYKFYLLVCRWTRRAQFPLGHQNSQLFLLMAIYSELGKGASRKYGKLTRKKSVQDEWSRGIPIHSCLFDFTRSK